MKQVRLAFDGSVIAEIAETPLTDLPAIIARGRKAAKHVAAFTREERASILRQAHAKFLAAREELARTIAMEGGKPIREARTEVDRAASTLLFSAEEAHRIAGEEIPMDAAAAGKGRVAMTIRQPLGLIAAITPFNFPLNLSMHKIGPAIAAGNAVIHKPAGATPMSALHAADILHSCGLPKEALQVVVGSGKELGSALVESAEVRMVTFTGSAAVGLGLKAKAGLKRVTLELGNNSAVLLFEDADLDAAIPACVAGAYAHSGQTCISVQRIYVHESIHEAFTARFTELAQRLRIAPPLDESSEIASLIDEGEAQRVQSWIGEAVREGATLRWGGGRNYATLQPAVLTNVSPASRLNKDEAFGPVVGINKFSSADQAIALANDSRYGLQTGVFTNNLKTAWRCAYEIESGGVLINDVSNYRVDQMPYGGWKESGTGKEGPRYAVEEMTESKLVSWRLGSS